MTEGGCGSGKKWECEYCTYQNWPSAGKCTMCRAARPVRLIAPDVPRQDIYQLGSSCPISTSPPPDTDMSTGKWSCAMCSYYNYPRY